MTRLATLPPGYVLEGDRARRVSVFPTSQEGQKIDMPPRDYLADLMASAAFKGRLGPEEEVSLWCAVELRRRTVARQLDAVWSMIPAENRQGGRLGAMHQARLLALGVVPGVCDFGFWWRDGSGLIELKVEPRQTSLVKVGAKLSARVPKKTGLRRNQPLFERWCEERGVRHAVARRWGEMEAVLQAWGRLSDGP